jgi:hypothetical protein
MKILIYPQLIAFHTGNPLAQICVAKLVGLNPITGFKRELKRVVFVSRIGMYQCRVEPGIYEVHAEESTDFRILIPQRIGLSFEVARELLQNPFALPKPIILAPAIGKAMTDLIFRGLSWVAATRVIGLGPNCEAPTPQDDLPGNEADR